MTQSDPQIAVVMADEFGGTPRGVKRYRRPPRGRLRDFAHWLILSGATDLPAVAAVVRDANKMKRLRGLLIHLEGNVQFATVMLQRADLHTLAHTFVHADMNVHRRVIEAWGAGAQHRLIADATLQRDTLFVRTCALQLLEVPARALPDLRRVREEDLAEFEVDPDGSFLHWPAADVHLGLDSIRAAIDPDHRDGLRVERLAYDEAFGAAIRRVRERAGLRQADIPGVSTKQVGRIERGEVRPRLATLRLLAAAHGLDTSAYLEDVAQAAQAR